MTVVKDSSTPAAPPKPDLVTCTIDGIEVSVPKGTLIIRAAEEVGIQIPRFCDHPLLDPVGACRQCLVEVPDMGNGRGMPKPPASCTTTVMPGMVVRTQVTSKVAEKAQRGNMEMLLINHPLDCPICDKGGECPLQNQAMSNGQGESRFIDAKRTFPKPVAISSQVLLDRERCIQCARCTRFSQQIAGDPFIELFERGAQEQIATAEGAPFASYYSGNTVQICPVGALTGASYRFRSRPFDLVSTPSVCEHCASGCAQRTDWRRGRVTRRLAGDDPEVNEEWNCDKGRWAFAYATAPDRITAPMVRAESGALEPASWPEALAYAAQGLVRARDAGGVGVLPGGRLTYEDAYAYAKFARLALRTNDIDHRSRPGSDEELDFLAARVAGTGPDRGGVTYAELEAAPTVLLAGLEPEEESPIIFLRLRKANRASGLKVLAVAPYTSRGLWKLGGTLLRTAPGAEAEMLRRLAGSAEHAEHRAALRAAGTVILVGERLAETTGGLSAAAALATATGAKLAWVPRRAGERGAVDAGTLPNLLPGGRKLADASARAEVEAAWGAAIPARRGRDGTAILAATTAGALGGLVVGGVDVDDLPDPEAGDRALEAAGFVVSLELRASSVTRHADVVLPVAPAVEKAGTYVDWEGRVRPFNETLEGTGAMSDSRVLHSLAEEMDVRLGLPTTAATRAELRSLGVRVGPRPADPGVPAAASAAPPKTGQARLATWHYLLDAGSLQDGEENLAGTAKPAQALISAATAAEIGVDPGGRIRVGSAAGSLVLPVGIADLPERVVFVPTNSRGAAVRRELRVGSGALVSLAVAPSMHGDAA